MRRLDVLNALAERVTDLRATHTLRVAIDGIDAAGKTTLADELALVLRAYGRPVIRASIDGFHQPRAVRLHRGSLSPEGYYLDSFDYAALRDVLLLPLGPGGSSAYRPAVFDYHTDQPRALPEERAPDPEILYPHDAIVRITSTAICGSDLHLYDGYIPAMLPGDILGHEFMGEVVEVGPEVHRIHVGDRVVVAFPIACGHCFFCSRELYSLCDNTNPHAAMVEKLWGYSPAGIFGYSQLLGGYAGGQDEFARVPFADVGMQVIPDGLSDEQVLFLSDILPTGYMAAEHCNIHAGDVIAVFGCGPVAQFAIQSARLLGASRAIAIDFVPERLLMAARHGGAETIDAGQTDVVDQLKLMTGGRGPDAVIDAVGMEAHGFGAFGLYDRVKQSMLLENDRGFVLRQAILGCRKGGTLSIPGVYSEFTDKVPIGALMNKGLTVRTGQTHVQRYMGPLLERIQRGELDPTFIITHKLPLDDAPHGYSVFKHKREGCVKVVLKP